MDKKIKEIKISINTVLLFCDILTIPMLSRNSNGKLLSLYISVRILMMCFVFLKILIKIFKASISIIRKSILSTNTENSNENSFDISGLFIGIRSTLFLNIEFSILLELFARSMDKVKNYMPGISLWALFIFSTLLNLSVWSIDKYVDKRCEGLLSI